jgi:antitoxin component YwqK of YwqJK toxin-antitoxin module
MRILITLLFISITIISFGQISDVKEKKKCYDEAPQQQKGYAAWECGKAVGYIDCNEELTYDEANDIVLRQAKDLSNLTGSGKPFTGKCEMCHYNGKIQRRVSFVNGKENGIDTTYYKSGCPQVVRNHIQGSPSGTWTYFYDSTNYTAWEMNYYLGEKHGKHIYMEADGDTTLWETYQNGLLHGTKREYYDDSKIKKEVEYKNGVFDGKFIVYNQEGIVIQELKYKEGQKDGENKFYYDDGTLLRTESWDEGVKHGAFKTFYYEQTVQVSENYKKGRKEGWFEEFYPDGITKRRALCEKDELIEEHRYDEHGRETYSFGTPSGDQNEDDEVPGSKKKKKKKDKKEK